MTVAKHKLPGQGLEKGGGSGGKRRGKRLDDDTDEEQDGADGNDAEVLSFGGMVAQNPDLMKTIDPDKLAEM